MANNNKQSDNSGNKKDTSKNVWSDSICLPQTQFPMRASLAQREPQIIEYWQKQKIYPEILKERKAQNADTFILHDGPPYANGNFHVGHGLNKILKDIIVKYQLIQGKYAPYVPGWDCHGLPIELAVMKKLANKKKGDDKDPVKIRKACRDYAAQYISVQAKDQTRFGVFWDDQGSENVNDSEQAQPDNFYYTMSQAYEADILEAFREIFKKGLIYKGKKPIHWCPHDRTALAEAEVEYADHTSPSIYVAFPVANEENTSVVIWTTTPWTLPANLGVAFHPEFVYNRYETEKGVLIFAEGLEESFAKDTGLSLNKKERITHDQIKNLQVKHPFIDRESRVLFGDHVTLEAGTGIVHTAPGHGHDDYVIGTREGLEPYSPVDHAGRYTAEFEMMQGKKVLDANKDIIELLKDKNLLIAVDEIEHSYPHCWRCHGPLIFRATPQWFFSVEPLKKRALEETKKIKWVPVWGQNRFEAMVENRPDWCLSRQRHWGVPIPAFTCTECSESHLSEQSLNHIIDLVKEKGIEVWFDLPVEELLPEGVQCEKCGSTSFVKENDILDVWFDSGVSWYSVAKKYNNLEYPADVYLEGSDQHRGWFQSSLWPSLALEDKAPYRQVITHGYILDDKGKAMSKSMGNNISPVDDIIPKYGADILRLWVSSEDYRTDNRISFDMLTQLSDSYRKIRNTFRYILGNLADGEQAGNLGDDDITEDIDKWALHELAVLGEKLKKAYNSHEFHQVYHSVLQYCTVTLSNTYFDIIRDRLYCDDSPSNAADEQAKIHAARRKSSLRALWVILDHLVVWLAPVLSFTTEEIQRLYDNKKSVFARIWPDAANYRQDAVQQKLAPIWQAKEEINLALEKLRSAGELKGSTEAEVVLPQKTYGTLLDSFNENDLAFFFVVSKVTIDSNADQVKAEKSNLEKCPRCWLHRDLRPSGLCERCDAVVGQ